MTSFMICFFKLLTRSRHKLLFNQWWIHRRVNIFSSLSPLNCETDMPRLLWMPLTWKPYCKTTASSVLKVSDRARPGISLSFKLSPTELYFNIISWAKACAVAQAVSRWLPTAAARVRFGAACGYMVVKAALGQVFSEYFGFPCQSFHQFLHHHNHPGLAQ
jgi:hypothetical protein